MSEDRFVVCWLMPQERAWMPQERAWVGRLSEPYARQHVERLLAIDIPPSDIRVYRVAEAIKVEFELEAGAKTWRFPYHKPEEAPA